MKIILINDIMRDIVFGMDDGARKWYSDMTSSEKVEANQLLRPTLRPADLPLVPTSESDVTLAANR